MTTSMIYWRDLAFETLSNPALVASKLIGLDLPRHILWTALLLVSVLNTLVYTFTNILVPAPSPLPTAFSSPFIVLLIVAGGLVLTVHALYWIGRSLGGRGDMGDILLLLIWLQALRLVVQGATLILLFVAPMMAALLVMASAMVGVWILVHFINVSLHFESLPRAAGVLVAAVLGLMFGLTLILSLIGASVLGSSGYV